MTGSGPLVVPFLLRSANSPGLLEKLRAKGIAKSIARLPIRLASERYAGHCEIVRRDPHQTGDLRVLDCDGSRTFRLFRSAELGEPVFYEPQA